MMTADLTLSAEKYSPKWLETIWLELSKFQDTVDDKLSMYSADTAPPVQTNKQKLLILSQQMETLQLDIGTKIDKLESETKISDTSGSETASATTSGSIKAFSAMLSTVKDTLNTPYSELMNNILALDTANLEQRLQVLEEFRRKYKEKVVSIELMLAKTKPDSPPPSTVQSVKGIEMEKSKAPVFSGRVIDYPVFKHSWQQVAGVAWEDANQVTQIKLKVDEDTRLIISRCKTMEEVWTELDKEYAQEQEVINAVNAELKSLRETPCSCAEYIVKLRNHLPTLEDVLKAVNGVEHLHSPERVNFMIGKFDERTMLEWEYFHSKNSGSTYARFFAFLVDRYDSSRSCIARHKAISLNVAAQVNHIVKCIICNEDGHFAHNCQNKQSINSTLVSSDCGRCNKWTARNGVHTCPGCGRGTQKDQKINHCLEHCGAYMSMSVNERSDCVERAKWCPIHLVGSHQLDDCKNKSDPKFICGINGCQKHHHKSLHNSTTTFVVRVNSTSLDNADDILLLVQTISTTSGPLNCLWDNASTCSLITNSAAERHQLPGEPMTIIIETVSGIRRVESYAYRVSLKDIKGDEYVITAYSVESISNQLKSVDISQVKGEFSKDLVEKWHLLDRPAGEIEILIGLNKFSLHPRDLECRGNLKVMSSLFGTGYLLGGSHPKVKAEQIQWNETVSNIRMSSVHTVNRVSVKPNYEFFAADVMGIQPPRRCGNCLKCKECTFLAQQLSQLDQYEYRVIDSKVNYVESQQYFQVQYPFTEDPRVLSKNRSQVIKIAKT